MSIHDSHHHRQATHSHFVCTGLLIVGLNACSGDDSGDDAGDATTATTASGGNAATTTAGGDAAAVAVTIEGFAFEAQPVPADQPFEVANRDSTAHTFTADDGAFDVELGAGATESVDGLAAGSYAFHCTIHPDMKGTLVVS
jgi:plastocyanin